MNVKVLINKWLNDEQTSEEFSEELQAAFATIDGHEVSMAWSPEAGLMTWGVINVDGEFYNEDGTKVGEAK